MNKLEIYDNAKELAWAAAMRFASLSEQAIKERGRFAVVLSGGSTPKAMLSILAGKPFADALPWQATYFFWGDERCVPPDHADSNYRMANEALLSKVFIPRENIFRIPAEDEDHDHAAASYSQTIRQFLFMECRIYPMVVSKY